MKKSTTNPIRKTALLTDKKTANSKFSKPKHPMARLEKQAPRKPMTHASRKGTAKSPRAG